MDIDNLKDSAELMMFTGLFIQLLDTFAKNIALTGESITDKQINVLKESFDKAMLAVFGV